MSDFEKDFWRKDNLRFMEGIPGLWDQGVLQPQYLEMIGPLPDTGGPSMFQLLEGRALPERLVAVDTDPKIVFDHKVRLAQVPPEERYQIYLADAYSLALNLSKTPEEPPLGICCFDDFGLAGNVQWWDGDKVGRVLHSIAKSMTERSEDAVIILNKALDRGETPSRGLLEKHTERVCHYFSDWGITQPGLHRNKCHALDDRDYTGSVGAYQIYRSTNRVLRMATLRLHITPNRIHLEN